MKKFLSLLTALCLLAGLMAGCGSSDSSADTSETSEAETASAVEEEAPASEEPVSEEPASEEAASEEPASEEPASEPEEGEAEEAAEPEPEETAAEGYTSGVSLNYPIADGDVTFTYCYEHMTALNAVGIDDYSDNPSWQLAQDVTGVNLDWVPLAPGSSGDTMSLWIASGDLPDITGVFSYSDGTDAAIEQNLIISFEDYLDWIPAYTALLESDESFHQECLSEDGVLASFCVMTNIQRRLDGGLMIRQDWLDELGMETPVTIDDLTDVLTAFHNNYGAGIGLYSGLATDSYSLCNAYGIAAFNTFEKYWYVVDGEVRMGMIQPEYKEYLTLLHSWYDAGLINEELILEMGMYMSAEVDQISSGEIGVWAGWVDSIPAWNANIGGNANVCAMADPVLNEGDILKIGGPSDSVKGDEAFYVTTSCSDPELALGFMDYFYTDDGIMVANFGVEDLTYTYNADGEPEFTDMILNNDLGLPAVNATQAFAIYSIGTYQYLTRYDSMYSETELNAFSLLAEHKTNEYEYSDKISMTSDETMNYSTIMSDINTYLSTATLQFVTGDRSLDEFDSYVADIEAMGIQDAIQIKQDAYDRYMAD